MLYYKSLAGCGAIQCYCQNIQAVGKFGCGDDWRFCWEEKFELGLGRSEGAQSSLGNLV